jgi:carotenoid cleavage dioxygenase-like enzyme
MTFKQLKNQFFYYIINNKLKKEKQINMNTKYMPMIHNFISLNNNIVILDNPMKFDME